MKGTRHFCTQLTAQWRIQRTFINIFASVPVTFQFISLFAATNRSRWCTNTNMLTRIISVLTGDVASSPFIRTIVTIIHTIANQRHVNATARFTSKPFKTMCLNWHCGYHWMFAKFFTFIRIITTIVRVIAYPLNVNALFVFALEFFRLTISTTLRKRKSDKCYSATQWSMSTKRITQ